MERKVFHATCSSRRAGRRASLSRVRRSTWWTPRRHHGPGRVHGWPAGHYRVLESRLESAVGKGHSLRRGAWVEGGSARHTQAAGTTWPSRPGRSSSVELHTSRSAPRPRRSRRAGAEKMDVWGVGGHAGAGIDTHTVAVKVRQKAAASVRRCCSKSMICAHSSAPSALSVAIAPARVKTRLKTRPLTGVSRADPGRARWPRAWRWSFWRANSRGAAAALRSP